MSISDMLTLQSRKKELENLLRNNNSSNNWLQQHTKVEEWKKQICRYESMISDNITKNQRGNIEQSIKRAEKEYEISCSILFNTLLHNIPKKDIENELEEIKQKEMEYMNILLENAKNAYKKELQEKIESI